MASGIETTKIILIPFISAFIGWMTNWVAIKMLFHPKKPIRLLFFTLHGTFYRKQKQLAENLGTIIEKQLISHDDIQRILSSDRFITGLTNEVEHYVDEFVDMRLKSMHPFLNMVPNEFLNLNKIKSRIVEEVESILPKMLKYSKDGLENQLNVKDLIQQKIEALDVSELEEVIFSIMKSELKSIEYVGGFLGFVIGLTQLVVVYVL